MSKVIEGLRYSEDHEWVKVEGNVATIGISDFAQKELGDIMWYVACMAKSFGWSLEEIMQLNIDKLKERYPDGFDTEKANNRRKDDV